MDNASLALIMKDWFLSFAVHMDPNARSWSGESKPAWPKYFTNGVGERVVAVDFADIKPQVDPDLGERCTYFWGKSDVIQN